jgi:hypothetical protein
MSGKDIKHDAGDLIGHRQEGGVGRLEFAHGRRIGGERGVRVGDELALQRRGIVASSVHTTEVRGVEPQPSAVSALTPALMPTGASGVSSAIAASAVTGSTSP